MNNLLNKISRIKYGEIEIIMPEKKKPEVPMIPLDLYTKLEQKYNFLLCFNHRFYRDRYFSIS